MGIRDTRAYRAIQAFYGERAARRSGVRLMDHIDQGLIVLDQLGSVDFVKRAFCLHPLFQADQELTTAGLEFVNNGPDDPYDLVLVMEYRQRANAWLSDKVRRVVLMRSNGEKLVTDSIEYIGAPNPGPLIGVRNMLIADKVQNYKDFRTYHFGTHARSEELDRYFKTWLSTLGIDSQRFDELWAAIDRGRAQ